MNKAFNKVSYSALICSFLTFIFLFSFNFVSSLEVSQWDKGNPSGNITNVYENNTYINQSNTFNDTQFNSTNPVNIKTSWLTTFINALLPDVSGFVPYTGATSDVDLNQNDLINVKNILLIDSAEESKISTIYGYNVGEDRYTGMELYYNGDAEKIFFRVADIYPLRLYSPADNTYQMEVEADNVLFDVTTTTFDGDINVGNIKASNNVLGDVAIFNQYVTNSYVSDFKSEEKTSDSYFINAKEWTNADGSINYEKHPAHVQTKETIITYDSKCSEQEIKDDKCNSTETIIIKDGLDLEFRTAELEKMVYDLEKENEDLKSRLTTLEKNINFDTIGIDTKQSLEPKKFWEFWK